MSKFKVPAAVKAHPAFKPDVTRQEAEFLLAMPGWTFVLRLNAAKSALVMSFLQTNGDITHATIDVAKDGKVLTDHRTFASLDAFVKAMRENSGRVVPTAADLRQNADLAPHVHESARAADVGALLDSHRLAFVLRKSQSIANAWVLSFQKAGRGLVHVPVRCEQQGYRIDGLDDQVFGSLIGVIQHLKLRLGPATADGEYDRVDVDESMAGHNGLYSQLPDMDQLMAQAERDAEESRRLQSEASENNSSTFDTMFTQIGSTLPTLRGSGAAVQGGSQYGRIGDVAPLYDHVDD